MGRRSKRSIECSILGLDPNEHFNNQYQYTTSIELTNKFNTKTTHQGKSELELSVPNGARGVS